MFSYYDRYYPYWPYGHHHHPHHHYPHHHDHHGHGIDLIGFAQTTGLNKHAGAKPALHQAFRHGGANGIHGAAKQNRLRRAHQIQRCQSLTCRAQISVNRRRAVSKSRATFPSSRASSRREPSLCRPRRPISMASIWVGVA